MSSIQITPAYRTFSPAVALSGPENNEPDGPVAAREAASARTKSQLRLTRRGRLIFLGLPTLFLAAALILGLGFFASPLKASSESVEGAVNTLTVQSGESLWTLAERSGVQRSTGDVVAEIIELNSLTSSQLRPGQVIQVPKR